MSVLFNTKNTTLRCVWYHDNTNAMNITSFPTTDTDGGCLIKDIKEYNGFYVLYVPNSSKIPQLSFLLIFLVFI